MIPFLLLLYRAYAEKQGTLVHGIDTILLFGKMKSPRLCRGLCMQGEEKAEEPHKLCRGDCRIARRVQAFPIGEGVNGVDG